MRAWVVPTAAVAASATVLMPITVVAAVVSGVLMDAGSEVVVGAVLAMVAGTVTYSAVFVTFGLYVKRTLLWGLVYVLIWEGFIAGAGQGVARFAVRAYTRSIIADVADVDIDLAEFSLATSIIVCLCVSAATLWLGIRRYSRMDVD